VTSELFTVPLLAALLSKRPSFPAGWLVGWGLTALLTQNRSYHACRFVGIFYSKL